MIQLYRCGLISHATCINFPSAIRAVSSFHDPISKVYKSRNTHAVQRGFRHLSLSTVSTIGRTRECKRHFSVHADVKYCIRLVDFTYYNCGRKFCSSDTENMADNRYLVGYAKLGTSSCKKCKQKIEKGALRIAKLVSNPFSDEGGDMKQWFHPTCIFETFARARATTKKIEDPEDVEGFADLQQEDKDLILKLIKGENTQIYSYEQRP